MWGVTDKVGIKKSPKRQAESSGSGSSFSRGALARLDYHWS
jgi:hypothetical protein